MATARPIRLAALVSLALGLVRLTNVGSASAAARDLTFDGCVGNLSGCTATTPTGALNGAEGVAVSGTNVYVAAGSRQRAQSFHAGFGGQSDICRLHRGSLRVHRNNSRRRAGQCGRVGDQRTQPVRDRWRRGQPLHARLGGDPELRGLYRNPVRMYGHQPNHRVHWRRLRPGGERKQPVCRRAQERQLPHARDSAGNPSFVGCIGGATGCTPVSPSNALNGAGRMALSGSNLYVADSFASNVSHLTLASNGTPTFAGCIGNNSGCTTTTPAGALDVAAGVAASTKGQNLYATGSSNSAPGPGAVSQLTLDAAGNPSLDLCVGEKSGCTASNPAGALDDSGNVLLDGQDLYVASLYGVNHLSLNSTGAPTFASCIGDLTGCTGTKPGGALADATGMAVSGNNLYVSTCSDWQCPSPPRDQYERGDRLLGAVIDGSAHRRRVDRLWHRESIRPVLALEPTPNVDSCQLSLGTAPGLNERD